MSPHEPPKIVLDTEPGRIPTLALTPLKRFRAALLLMCGQDDFIRFFAA